MRSKKPKPLTDKQRAERAKLAAKPWKGTAQPDPPARLDQRRRLAATQRLLDLEAKRAKWPTRERKS